MVRLAWVYGIVVASGVFGIAAEARATCGYDCELMPVYADCTEAVSLEGNVYEWEQTDGLRVLASCTETCCAPIEDGCGDPYPVDPPLGSMRIRGEVEGDIEVGLSLEEACGGAVVVAPFEMQAGEQYTISVEGSGVSVEVVDVESEAAGCRVGGTTGAGGLGLLLLSTLVAGRRRERR